jgi:hypothetical protein
MASFQARRRKAAKLTHFFGVDYRILIGDVLESIERDMQEENHKGSLHPEEMQVCQVFFFKVDWLKRICGLGPYEQAA